MKVLFVCSLNNQRSQTAKNHFAVKYPNFEFKSAGTNHKKCAKNGRTPLTDELMKWADVVFVMQQHHANMIEKYGKENNRSKVVVLGILDEYEDNNQQLIALLETKVDLS